MNILLFVSKQKYIYVKRLLDQKLEELEKARRDLEELRCLSEKLWTKYEMLRLNGVANGGLTNKDIKILLSLCHPDKHDGKKIANDMTVKLLKMKA